MHASDGNRWPAELDGFIRSQASARGISPDPLVAHSWYRSEIEHGLSAQRQVPLVVLEHHELRQQQQRQQHYLNIASQGVAGLAQRIAKAGFSVMLSDEHGVVLDCMGEHVPQAGGRHRGLVLGSCWDEAMVGTNGIGTGLVARQPLVIHQAEHFLSANFGLSCSVAPIFDPQGALKGCLNASCLHSPGPKQAQYLTLQLVVMYARMIENAYLRQSHRDGLTLSLKPRDEIADLANEQLLALDPQGRIIAANHASFQAYPDLLGRSIESLLPMGVDELLHFSRGGANSVLLRTLATHALVEVGLRVPRQLPAQTAAARPMAARPSHSNPLDRLAGQDPNLQRDTQRLLKVLDKGLPILLQGETGTGKEAFAKAIHQASQRRQAPFVALNCAALPESLIESELFGYRAGSFTGADKKGMKGKLELANGGTLFLDEIGDMPIALQTRLLRVLAERELLPLGAQAPIALDIQVISATHQDLPGLIEQQRFRADLYYRLCGFRLELPALRQRQDVESLVEHLLATRHAGLRLGESARAILLRHDWPGNIRQLITVLDFASAMAESGVIEQDCLPDELALAQPHNRRLSPPEPLSDSIGQPAAELLACLRRHRWNISACATELGVARTTLYRRMRQHGIVPPNQQ